MKKLSCLSGLLAFAFIMAGCANMQSPSAPIDNVINTVGDAFGNISGQKSGRP
ncbi:hypothetical protein [Advenella mandrilli]|nr:hypothetical protein [Advenella mandrilli]